MSHGYKMGKGAAVSTGESGWGTRQGRGNAPDDTHPFLFASLAFISEFQSSIKSKIRNINKTKTQATAYPPVSVEPNHVACIKVIILAERWIQHARDKAGRKFEIRAGPSNLAHEPAFSK
jgi:hypothetical protein